jgi:hypothetical protein
MYGSRRDDQQGASPMDGSKNGQAGEPVMVPAGAPTVAAVAKRLTALATGRRGRSHQLRRRKGPPKGGAHGDDGAHGGASGYNSTRAALMGGGGVLDGGDGHGQGGRSNLGSGRCEGNGVDSTEQARRRETSRGSGHADADVRYRGLDQVSAGGFGSNRVWRARSGLVRLLGRLLGVEMRTRPDLVDGPAMGGSGVEGPDWVVVGLRVSRRHSAAWRRRGHDQDD